MITFPSSAGFLESPAFSEQEVLEGVPASFENQDEAGCIRIDVDGAPECLRFYGLRVGAANLSPLIYLEGDCTRRDGKTWSVFKSYAGVSPYSLQLWAEQVALSIGRTFVALGRPGVYGSSGNHQQRRRPREFASVNAAVDALTRAFGWDRIHLAGFSGGGHLVAALMARRADIGCAVIASGNVSVRQRNTEKGRQADVTGYTDFVDPIELVSDVALHPPERVVVLTDPQDTVVSAACQTAYVEALRAAGVPVDHRLVPALGSDRHSLGGAALLAATSSFRMTLHGQ